MIGQKFDSDTSIPRFTSDYQWERQKQSPTNIQRILRTMIELSRTITRWSQ